MEEKTITYLTPEQQEAATAREERYYMRKCIDEEKNRSSNYFFGFWGALSGALAGAILYGCIRSNGVIASIAGLFVVFMASKAYDATKVKRNINKLYCVILACVLALPVGEFIGCVISMLADEATSGYTMDFIRYYINNFGEFLSESKINLVLGYVFTAIGGYKVIKDIKAQDKKLEEMEEALAQYEETE
ncbi:MAG: hypothetical protein IJ435_10215 [Clostridia bacterium]|nr:hypothetical protein [Clostridia bacterium]